MFPIINIDECLEGIHNCSENARCENTLGSYTCTCQIGFEGDGEICTSIHLPTCIVIIVVASDTL